MPNIDDARQINLPLLAPVGGTAHRAPAAQMPPRARTAACGSGAGPASRQSDADRAIFEAIAANYFKSTRNR